LWDDVRMPTQTNAMLKGLSLDNRAEPIKIIIKVQYTNTHTHTHTHIHSPK